MAKGKKEEQVFFFFFFFFFLFLFLFFFLFLFLFLILYFFFLSNSFIENSEYYFVFESVCMHWQARKKRTEG